MVSATTLTDSIPADNPSHSVSLGLPCWYPLAPHLLRELVVVGRSTTTDCTERPKEHYGI